MIKNPSGQKDENKSTFVSECNTKMRTFGSHIQDVQNQPNGEVQMAITTVQTKINKLEHKCYTSKLFNALLSKMDNDL